MLAPASIATSPLNPSRRALSRMLYSVSVHRLRDGGNLGAMQGNQRKIHSPKPELWIIFSYRPDAPGPSCHSKHLPVILSNSEGSFLRHSERYRRILKERFLTAFRMTYGEILRRFAPQNDKEGRYCTAGTIPSAVRSKSK